MTYCEDCNHWIDGIDKAYGDNDGVIRCQKCWNIWVEKCNKEGFDPFTLYPIKKEVED